MAEDYRSNAVLGVSITCKAVAGHPSTPAAVQGDPHAIERLLQAVAPPGIVAVAADGSMMRFLFGVRAMGVVGADIDESFVPMPDVEALRASLRSALEPRGWWDASTFGLHVGLQRIVEDAS